MFSSILIIILVAKGKQAAIFWAHNILRGFFHDLASSFNSMFILNTSDCHAHN